MRRDIRFSNGIYSDLSTSLNVLNVQVPKLEEWFLKNSHPSHSAVAVYTDTLNKLPYR